MKPIGPLMIEHRIIERMIELMKTERQRIDERKKADFLFIYNTIDFFSVYVDDAHHGKEEKIQFKTLAEKNMSPEMRRIMDELIKEHDMARDIIKALNDALAVYDDDKPESVKDISGILLRMIKLYPMHIEKEDKHFFIPSLEYLDQNEQDAMLQAFWEYDRNIIQGKYIKLIEEMKASLDQAPG